MDEVPDTESLQTWLFAAFAAKPDWAIHERATVPSYQQGMERIALLWPTTGETQTVFVRTYRGYMSWWNLIAHDLPQRELTAMRAAGRVGVPVPEVLFVTESPDVQILATVPGRTGQIPTTPQAVENIAAIMARLHTTPIGDQERRHLPDISLSAFLPRLRSWAEEAGDAALQEEVDAFSARARSEEIDERPATLVHGDLHPGNYLVDTDTLEVSGVIDWEEAALGDPRIDVALLYFGLKRAPETEELADHLRRAYEARAGFALGPLEFWRDLARLRNRVTSARVKHALAIGETLPSANPEVWIRD